MRSCSPRRHSVSTVSSVRQTIRLGGTIAPSTLSRRRVWPVPAMASCGCSAHGGFKDFTGFVSSEAVSRDSDRATVIPRRSAKRRAPLSPPASSLAKVISSLWPGVPILIVRGSAQGADAILMMLSRLRKRLETSGYGFREDATKAYKRCRNLD
jgi:hypothetical protein